MPLEQFDLWRRLRNGSTIEPIAFVILLFYWIHASTGFHPTIGLDNMKVQCWNIAFSLQTRSLSTSSQDLEPTKPILALLQGEEVVSLHSTGEDPILEEEQFDFWASSFDANDGKALIRSFYMDLQNLAQEDPQMAQDALEIMQQLYLEGKHPEVAVDPDTVCYNIVLEGWLESGRVKHAEKLLYALEDRLDQLHSMNGSDFESASSASSISWSYLMVTKGWANEDVKDEIGAERAESLLRRLLSKVERERKLLGAVNTLSPSLDSCLVQLWNIALEAWCKRSGLVPVAMQRALSLLEDMEASFRQRKSSMTVGTNLSISVFSSHMFAPPPNVLVYTTYISGLSRSKELNLARQAEEVLERMRKHDVQPDMVAYTAVLNCWSKSVSRREREMAASRAIKILEEMERQYIREEQYIVKPSSITYATAIRAIGRSLDPQAVPLAEAVLARMYHLYRTGLITNLKPSTQSYNALLHALSMSPGDETQKLRNARRAEEIIMKMMRLSKKNTTGSSDDFTKEGGERDIEPDVRTWAAVLRAWAQCGSALSAENCQRVLDMLVELRESGETSIRPNFVCYTTVMGAWGHSRRKDGLERMECLLRFMEDSYEQSLEADIRPNTVSYVTAIDAFVRRNEPDSSLRAQATLDRMLRLYAKGLGHVRPARTIFNCLINAYSKSKDRNAAKNAERIFQWMETQARVNGLERPDGISLCGVLNAWANQGSAEGAERALQIWKRMESISTEKRGFELSIMMPNIVIKAIARTRNPKAVEKAEEILLKLEKNYYDGYSRLRPDVTTASSVINAAAFYVGDEDGRRLALKIAMRTFRKITDWGLEPNNITFGTLLKAVSNLLQPSDHQRETLTRELFDHCCESGYVDGFVLAQIRQTCPDLYRELVDEPCGLGGPSSDTSVPRVLRNIPSEWSANVVE